MSGCSVYMFRGPVDEHTEGFFKIGISKNVGSRLNELKTGCPFPLVVGFELRMPDRPTALLIETRIHDCLAQWRMEGEWFHMNVVGALCEIECLLARYWCEELGRPASWLGRWFQEIGHECADVQSVLDLEGFEDAA